MTTDLRTRYRQRLPIMREIAHRHGYALAVHGSETRDFDVIAVPWTDNASNPVMLVEAIRNGINGIYSIDKTYPVLKPHGRLAWSIQIGGSAYIDLSVTPRLQDVDR